MAMAFSVSTAATTYYRRQNGVGNRQHRADFVHTDSKSFNAAFLALRNWATMTITEATKIMAVTNKTQLVTIVG